MTKSNLKILLLFLLFLLFCFFRFYQLEQRIIFDWDQERDAFIIKQLISERKLTLIGPRVIGPEGFYLGPYYHYLLSPFYLFTNLHPRAMIYFIISYNLIFFWFAFFVLKKIFDEKISFLFLFYFSLHPYQVGVDQIAWNPLILPFLIILLWFLLFKIYSHSSLVLWFILGLITGLGVNFHFQFLFLLPSFLPFIFISKLKTMRERMKVILFLILGIILPFLPIAIFDLRHQFLNLNLAYRLFFGERGVFNPFVWWFNWRNFLVSFWSVDFPFIPYVSYLLFLFLILVLIKKEKGFNQSFFLGFLFLWLFFPLGFIFFGRQPSEYYFHFLYPYLILLIPYFLLKVTGKFWLTLLILFLLLIPGFSRLKEGLSFYPLGLFQKDQAISRVASLTRGKKFNLSFSVPLGMDTGYRYLMEYYQIKQSGDFKDALIRITIPPKEEEERYGRIGLDIPERL